MNVTDGPKAQSAATIVVGALAGHAVMMLFSVALTGFLIERIGFEAWQVGNQLVYLVIDGALAFGLFQLASALSGDEAGLVRLGGIAVGASILLDVVMTVLERAHLIPSNVMTFAWDFNLLVSLGMRAVLLLMFVKTAGARFAWVIPLVLVVGVLTLTRSAFTIASMHQLISYEDRGSFLFKVALPLVSTFNVFGVLACGVALRSAVIGAPQTQAVLAQAGLQPAAPVPVNPAADFVVGGILLAVGLGVSLVSYSAASGGGRYVVATGAIGVGLGRIIRGAIRAAKG